MKKLDRDKEFSANEQFYKGMVWVFANISGLVTFTPEGVIHSCNHNFSLMLFGYQEKELVGRVSTFSENFKYRCTCILCLYRYLFISRDYLIILMFGGKHLIIILLEIHDLYG